LLSEIERDEIYGEPKEIDGDTIIWESRGNKDRFYLKVPVRRANGEPGVKQVFQPVNV
jgi:hypothetical protein